MSLIYFSIFADQRQANASLVAQLPPSSSSFPAQVFDHPIIGFDQQPKGGLTSSASSGAATAAAGDKKDQANNIKSKEKEDAIKKTEDDSTTFPHAPQQEASRKIIKDQYQMT